MKNIKKLASLLLVMVMIFTLAASAFATDIGGETQPDEPAPSPTLHTITIIHKGVDTGHTYKAYQIFSGSANTIGNDTVLSDVQWGTGVNDTRLLTALKSANAAYNDCSSAESVASVIAGRRSFGDNFAIVVGGCLTDVATSSGAGTPSTDDAGKPTTKYQISGLSDGYYLVKDANPVTGNDSSTRYILQVVGGDVEVKAKNSVPTVTKEVYDINDTTPSDEGWGETADHDIGDNVSFKLTASLSSNFYIYNTYKLVFHDSLSAGLDFNESSVKITVADIEIAKQYYTVNYHSETHTFEVTIPNLKDSGVSGITGSNSVIVTYTARLNENAVVGGAGNPNEVYLEFSNDPYSDETGETPPDKVTVFTFSAIVHKVHEVGQGENKAYQPLKGAAFKLEKSVPGAPDGGWKLVDTIEDGGDTATFTFTGLDDGKYRLTETKVPLGYNKIDEIYFKVVTTHGVDAAGQPVHTIRAYQVEGNSDTEVEGTGVQVFTSNEAGDTLSTDVVNKAGATLPTTGGIGTTLFYVIGSVLVLAAVVLLVTKKRMNAQN